MVTSKKKSSAKRKKKTATPSIAKVPMAIGEDGERIGIIRTSDRQGFKRCRRRWHFQSHLRLNLDQIRRPSYFWIGTGGHFAMEDWHGHNYYGHPVEAFRAYVEGCKRASKRGRIQLPDDYPEQVTLGEGILDNYLNWCKNRDAFNTLWIDGEPQVEQTIYVDLTPYLSDSHEADRLNQAHWTDHYDRIFYRATIDRLIEVVGEIWIADWKFLKSFDTNALEYDSQLSAYLWIANAIFVAPVAGAYKHMFRKELPKIPKILANGKLSTAKNQMTNYGLYRESIVDIYGSTKKAPPAVVDCLNDLSSRENEDRDDFIKRERTRRTQEEMEAEGTLILMEVEDMINPGIPIYKNSTRDCSWDCQQQEVCLMIDRDEDWEPYLKQVTVLRTEESDEWRKHLPK